MKMSFDLQVFLLCFLPLLFALLVLRSYFSSSKSHKNLPPSPPKLPLIGNLHQLGLSMHAALHSMAQTYGPVMLLHFGTVPVVVTSSVEAFREIMKTQDITFANKPVTKILTKLAFDGKDIAFAAYGEHWRQVKSISVLHLLSNKRVQSYRQVREEEIAHMIKTIQGANGSVIDLSEIVTTLTNSVISRVAMGRRFEHSKIKPLLDRFLDLVGRFSFATYIPSLGWIDILTGLDRKTNELIKEVNEFCEDVIREHENKKQSGDQDQDLVDILLEIQRDNSSGYHLERDVMKAVLFDMFVGGTDTTFTPIDWAINELLQNPRVMKELQQEAHKTGQGRSMIPEDDLDKMPYLKAVLKESLRLHPPAPILGPRTRVMMNIWAVSRDPSIWEEPEKFRPERFLNTTIDYKDFDFEFVSFGAGRRGCPGINFSMVLNEFALANLVYKFNFALLPGECVDMTETLGLTIHRKFPTHVTATPCK
ncbi:putative cytochrome P450 [Helianthus annuus]|nr:putative cytochrome P450 [Helianthus annuus]KAJ0957370.1 putative cytochrome P450 [Helianthus annuus]